MLQLLSLFAYIFRIQANILYIAARLLLAFSMMMTWIISNLRIISPFCKWTYFIVSDLTSKLMADCLKIGFLGKLVGKHFHAHSTAFSIILEILKCNCKVIEMIYKWRILENIYKVIGSRVFFFFILIFVYIAIVHSDICGDEYIFVVFP